jgi:hypothetical protein
MPKHDQSVGRDQAPGWTGQILALQRASGNRAVTGLLSGRLPVTVQRLKVNATELAPYMTKQATFGRSSFGRIHSTLVRYERAGENRQKRTSLLEQLDALCTDWYNKHARSKDPQDVARRGLVESLMDSIPIERGALARSQAQDIYMGNIAMAGQAPSYVPPPPSPDAVITVDEGSDDPAEKYALEALTTASKSGVAGGMDKQARNVMEGSSLTEAEVAAIRIFTGEDYKYINPAMAGSTWEGKNPQDKESWLTENIAKEKANKSPTFDRGASYKAMREEGGLHAGVAMQGLRKLPLFTGQVYRGAGYTDEDFRKGIVVGKVFAFSAFASSSKNRAVAEKFARDQKDKTCMVIFVLHDSGGRDVSKLSLAANEAEVTLLPGSKYSVEYVKEIQPPQQYLDQEGGRLDRTWYEVGMGP